MWSICYFRCSWNLNFMNRFLKKILKYQISWNSVQGEPSISMRTDRRMDSHADRQEATNSLFSQFLERAQKQMRLTENKWKSFIRRTESLLRKARVYVVRYNKWKKRYTMAQTGSMEIVRRRRDDFYADGMGPIIVYCWNVQEHNGKKGASERLVAKETRGNNFQEVTYW